MEMDFHKGQRSLPDTLNDAVEQERVAKRVRNILNTANYAYKQLRTLASKSFGGGKNMPDNWEGFTDEWVEKNINRRVDTLGSMPLTEGLINRIMGDWNDKRKEGKQWVKELQTLHDLKLSGAIIKEEYGTHILRCPNLDEIADAASKIEIDKTCKELWRLAQNVRDALNRLNNFCKNNDLKEIEPNRVAAMDNPQAFAEAFAVGMYSNHLTDQQNKTLMHSIVKNQSPYGEGKCNLVFGG